MYSVELTTTQGNKVTIFFSTNITVSSHIDRDSKQPVTKVMDGLHNNGGWEVKETYADVVNLIKTAKSLKY